MPIYVPGKLTLRNQLPADTEADAYIAAVEAADGQALEPGVKFAIKNFVLCCKQDGIWNSIKASCILAGARTLAGALVPLVGTAPTNFNFVAGDYNRKTGLAGNGSTKYLNTNRAGNADPQNSNHLAVYGTSFPSSFSYYAGLLNTHFGWNASAIFSRNNSTGTGSGVASNAASLVGIARSSSTSFVTRSAGQSATALVVSQVPATQTATIFAANLAGGASGFSGARLSFYSIGESLNLALLDARVTDLMNAIGAAIP